MLYPSMKELLKDIDNRYLLVNVVARRAREIAEEAEEQEEPLDEKPVTLAVEEIADGRLTIERRAPEDGEQEADDHAEPLAEPEQPSEPDAL